MNIKIKWTDVPLGSMTNFGTLLGWPTKLAPAPVQQVSDGHIDYAVYGLLKLIEQSEFASWNLVDVAPDFSPLLAEYKWVVNGQDHPAVVYTRDPSDVPYGGICVGYRIIGIPSNYELVV